MPKIEIPKQNPEMLYNLRQSTSEKYRTKPFMTTLFQESLQYYQKINNFRDNSNPQYFRLKNLSGYIALQIASPAWDTFEFKVIGSDGTEYDAPSPIADTRTITGDLNEDGEQLIKIKIYLKLSDLITDEGYYCWYCKFTYLDSTIQELVSDPVWVLEQHENVINWEYWNDENDFDIWWEMTPNFSVLLPANIEYSHDELKRIVFLNQKANHRLLYAQNWSVFDLEFGFPGAGINSYDQNKIYNIFKCSHTYGDNVRYLMPADADFEKVDFGKAYALKNLKTQVVLYDQKDSVTVGGAGSLYVMDLGELRGYPYAITRMYLDAGTSELFNYLLNFTNEIAEILDSTMQNDAIAQWNLDAIAFGRTGEFVNIDDKLYYKRGEGETETTSSAYLQILDTCLQIWFENSVTDEGLDILVEQAATGIYAGKTVISVWRDSTGSAVTDNMIVADYIPVDSGDTFSETYHPSADPDFDNWRMFIYTNNVATVLNISNIANNILEITGSVSSKLIGFSAEGGAIGTLDTTFLRTATERLIDVALVNMGISTLSTGFLARILPNDWKYLYSFFIQYNNLDDTNQDLLYAEMWGNVVSYWLNAYSGGGEVNSSDQTPPSAPTSGTVLARASLVSAGTSCTF